MRRFAVVGSPIEHSLSPLLHNAVFKHFGLDMDYQRIETQADQLEANIAGLEGASVTMPLKDRAFEIAVTHDRYAKETRVVNTLLARLDGWQGFNTDAPGIEMVLADRGVSSVKSAIVIGNGATARSAVAALRPVAASLSVMARNQRSITGVDSYLPWGSHLDAEVVISTVPSGAADHLSQGEGLLIDVLYAPWPSALAQKWVGESVSGLELLVNQAALQSQLFLQGRLDVAIVDDLDAIRGMMRRALP